MGLDKPKLLILTLYCGENEYAQCRDSVAQQSFKNVEHVTFENLPNIEAHQTLYQTIMDRAGEFDLFMKLDADMVLRDEDALARVVRVFQDNPKLDHAIFAVHDYLPDKLSWGVHVFSNRVYWEFGADDLFVDLNPHYNGAMASFFDDFETIVDHAPDPHPYHAFHFGLHRGLKAFQWGRLSAHPQALGMWPALESTWRHFERTRDYLPGLAMMGGEMARLGRAGQEAGDKNNEIAKALFEACMDLTPEQMYERLSPFWARPLWRKLYWWALVASRVYPPGALRRLGILSRQK